jgi:signal peptidase II
MTSATNRRLWALVAFIVTVDQLTKHWALGRLSGGRTIDLVGSLRFNLAFNRGMAFSRGSGLGPIIGAVAFLIVIVIVLWIRRSARGLPAVAASSIVGGAIGNLVDRLFRGEAWLRGAVVDFIDLQWFPVFNVADSAITIGAVLMMLASLRQRQATGTDVVESRD